MWGGTPKHSTILLGGGGGGGGGVSFDKYILLVFHNVNVMYQNVEQDMIWMLNIFLFFFRKFDVQCLAIFVTCSM